MNVVSGVEAAAQLGISKQAVSKNVERFVAAGLLNATRHGRRLFFDLDKYREAQRQLADPARAGSGKANAVRIDLAPPAISGAEAEAGADPADPVGRVGKTFATAKVDLEDTKAKLAKLDLAQRLGKTCRVDDVETAAFEAVQGLWRELEGRRRGLSEDMASMTNPREIAARLEQEDRALMKRLGDVLTRSLGAAEAVAA